MKRSTLLLAAAVVAFAGVRQTSSGADLMASLAPARAPALFRAPSQPPLASRPVARPASAFLREAAAALRACARAAILANIPPSWIDAPVVARVEGPWLQEKGFRLRVVYREAIGLSVGTKAGYLLERRGWTEPILQYAPPSRRTTTAVYDEGAEFPYSIELESTGGAFPNLEVYAGQEELTGETLTPLAKIGAARLESGGRAVIEAKGKLLGRASSTLNFERTHVTIYASDAGGKRPLADEAEAGVVDPPRL